MSVQKMSTSVSPPSSIHEYGKGDFLVGFWGESIKYSKDSSLWYEHPKHYDWAKGNYVDLSDFTENDNNKILDFSSTPIFINYFNIRITCTGTNGSRKIPFKLIGSETTLWSYNAYMEASESTLFHFGFYEDNNLTGLLTNDISLPKFWNENIPFWNKINVKDNNDKDSNDDFFISLTGVYALPKYNWIEFKNCKNFQIQKVTETLNDGIFSLASSLPRSLKVLKI